MSLEEISKIYFTNPEHLNSYLLELDKGVVTDCFTELLHRYAIDVNSSALREFFTLIKAGYQPRPGKLGYNGEASDGRPCDVKPINIRSDSGDLPTT